MNFLMKAYGDCNDRVLEGRVCWSGCKGGALGGYKKEVSGVGRVVFLHCLI